METEWTSRDELVAACLAEPERIADVVLMLLQRVRELERRVNENSGNSNKPSSCDGYR